MTNSAYVGVFPIAPTGPADSNSVDASKGEAECRHLEALHPATRKGLLEPAREADPLALRWGK